MTNQNEGLGVYGLFVHAVEYNIKTDLAYQQFDLFVCANYVKVYSRVVGKLQGKSTLSECDTAQEARSRMIKVLAVQERFNDRSTVIIGDPILAEITGADGLTEEAIDRAFTKAKRRFVSKYGVIDEIKWKINNQVFVTDDTVPVLPDPDADTVVAAPDPHSVATTVEAAVAAMHPGEPTDDDVPF